MTTLGIVLVAIGLAADAFAAALTQGVSMRRLNYRAAALIALTFGVFQAVMPVMGFALASQFHTFLAPIDHWIAFGMLFIIGALMVREALSPDEPCGHDVCPPSCDGTAESSEYRLSIKSLILLGIGTSIDAAAVGVSFAVLKVSMLKAALIIGVITAALSFAAVVIGNRVGTKWRTGAELAGGAILIVIGLRILITHLVGA